jgi:hypothetical protein
MKIAVLRTHSVKWDCSIGSMVNEQALAELDTEFIFVADWDLVAVFVLHEGYDELYSLISDYLSEEYGWLIEDLYVEIREAEMVGHLFRERLIEDDLSETLRDVCDETGWDTKLTKSERNEAKGII